MIYVNVSWVMLGLGVGSCFAAFCQVPESEPDDEPDPLDSVLLASEDS